jgi:hypothetical protein
MQWLQKNQLHTFTSHKLSLSLSPQVPFPTNNIITTLTLTGNSERGKREERMTTVAAEMMLRCVFDGCLSMQDMEIERRPYHRNCSCQLHKLKGFSFNACPHQRNVSFPKKHSWTDCCPLSIAASKSSSQRSLLGDLSSRNREDGKFLQRLDMARLEEN